MSKQKLTRERLRQIIREEKQKLEKKKQLDETSEQMLQVQDKLEPLLMNLEELFDRNNVHDIANDMRYYANSASEFENHMQTINRAVKLIRRAAPNA